MTTKEMARQVRLQHWAKVLRERKEGGLSIRRWCWENGVVEKTYYYWQRKLRENVCESLDAAPSETLPATFTQVRLAGPPAVDGKLIIRLNGAEVEIQGDVPITTVEGVVQVMRRL